MDPETAPYAFDVALCARCDFPTGDLSCPRCAKTLRRQTVPPGSKPFGPDAELDRALAWLEERLAARITRLTVDIEGVLGRGGRIEMKAEVWGKLETLLLDNDATPDERDERVAWARRLTQRRHLEPLTVSERYRLGDRISSPDVEAFGMLLHARLARAQLALPGFERRAVQVEDEGGVVRCLVSFSDRRGMRFLTIELAAIPVENHKALADVCAWVDELSKGWSGAED